VRRSTRSRSPSAQDERRCTAASGLARRSFSLCALRPLALVGFAGLTLFGGCARRVEDRADASVPSSVGRLSELGVAEWSRDLSRILPEDLASRDVLLRRRAVRAMSRVANDASRQKLERALADEDPEVVAWAAFGLGRLCKRADADVTVRRLVARAANLMLTSGPRTPEVSAALVDPWFALAEALGRCASKQSERVLRSWASSDPELARVAVHGLAEYVQVAHELEASTIVVLLEAAEKERRLAGALLALSRLERLEPLVGRRLLTMAPQLLEQAGEERRYLLRALPLVGKDAIPILERIVIDDGHYQPLERVEAIRALGKMAAPGQEVLGRALSRLATFASAPSEAELLSAKWLIWVELFEQLKEAPATAEAALGRLAALEIPRGRKPAEYRRISFLRCRAAALLSVDDIAAKVVAQCDPTENQREKKLTQVAILDRLPLKGKNASAYELLAAERDPVVAIAALSLIANHDELTIATELLTEAVGAESMGIVATAARILAERPPRLRRGTQPSPELATALGRALEKHWPPDAVEVRVNLIDAAAELGYLSVKPSIVGACKSDVPKVREHAERALRRLGESNQRCDASAIRGVPKEATHVATRPVTLRFHTDIGPLELRLDPTLAPVAVTRVIDLAKAGFYDGLTVHRVVPGFVIQFGDRLGDGYGGAGVTTIPCELSPQPFGPLDVGMALSGSDSGSSQVFVTLGPYPQLGAEYSRIGRAGVGWDQLFVGDRIDKVELVP